LREGRAPPAGWFRRERWSDQLAGQIRCGSAHAIWCYAADTATVCGRPTIILGGGIRVIAWPRAASIRAVTRWGGGIVPGMFEWFICGGIVLLLAI